MKFKAMIPDHFHSGIEAPNEEQAAKMYIQQLRDKFKKLSDEELIDEFGILIDPEY